MQLITTLLILLALSYNVTSTPTHGYALHRRCGKYQCACFKGGWLEGLHWCGAVCCNGPAPPIVLYDCRLNNMTWQSLGGALNTAIKALSWTLDGSRIDIFSRDYNYFIVHKVYNGAWGPWESLGPGVIQSEPAIVSWGPNRIDVFGVGTDSQCYTKFWNGSSWNTNWASLGGSLGSAPTAVSWGIDRIDLFVVGTDGGCWQQYWDGLKWSGWGSLGGVITSQPSAVSWGSNRLDVFALGTDYAVWHNAWNGSAWSSWFSLGGSFSGRPTAISSAFNQIDVFAVDTNHTLQHKTWNGSTWDDWTSMELQSYSAVKACSTALNQLDVFALGNNSSCWHKGWNGSSWSSWEMLGGLFESAMDAVCFSPTSIKVFGLGTDSAGYSASVSSPTCKSIRQSLITLATGSVVFTSPIDIGDNGSGARGPGRLSAGAIGGIVGGVLGAVIFICFTCIFYLVRRQRKVGKQNGSVTEIPEGEVDNTAAKSPASNPVNPSGRLNYPEAQY